MSLYDDLRKNLSPDDFAKVTDALGDDFDYDVVPRSRLNKVIKQRNALREQLAEGSQNSGKTGGGDGQEDDDLDNPTPATTQPKAKGGAVDEKALRTKWEEEQKAREEALRIEFAALNQLREDGAIDPELVLTQMDRSKIKRENGKLTGYTEQLDALRESKSFLFHQKRQRRQDTGSGTGKSNGEGDPNNFEGVMTRDDFLKLGYTEQVAFKQAHPEQFAKFLGM